jgi:hypothetical protein
MLKPNKLNHYQLNHAQLLISSFYRLTGRYLLPGQHLDRAYGRRLFQAPFAVVSHGTEEDPLFNYANQTALNLFNMSWEALIGSPSRQSAEPVNQLERRSLLDQVQQQGYIDNYRGIRISSTGCRFCIERATVWNLINESGQFLGQAAMFADWHFLD